MKAFFAHGASGDFGQFYVDCDNDKVELSGDNIIIEADAEQVYPEMVLTCDMDVSTKITAPKETVLFEDELINKLVEDIAAEADVIKLASDNIAKEEDGKWSADHLFQIDSRVDVIKEHVKKIQDILEVIYG